MTKYQKPVIDFTVKSSLNRQDIAKRNSCNNYGYDIASMATDLTGLFCCNSSLLEHVSIVNTWVGTDGSSNLYKWVGSWTSLGAFRFWKVLNDRTAREDIPDIELKNITK
ncbi:unnamed protein product [Rhizophagus irregularis]|nr:unnamed protein product [Rhizophagus irregularis]